MSMKVEGDKIIIGFDPNSTQLSKSGKTLMLGSSGGFVWVKDGKKGEIGISYNIAIIENFLNTLFSKDYLEVNVTKNVYSTKNDF